MTTLMEDLQLEGEEEVQEAFSRDDRTALIKQGVMIDQLAKEVHDLKVAVREASLELKLSKGDASDVSDHETRIRMLEESQTRFTAQLKTIMWVGGLIITAIQVTVEILLHLKLGA